MDIKTYEQAVRWLYDRIDYERIRPSGQSNPFRLERVEQLLMCIGSPHRRIKAVHIAGTKGKGTRMHSWSAWVEFEPGQWSAITFNLVAYMKVVGSGGAEKVIGEIFTEMINRLNVERLFQQAKL